MNNRDVRFGLTVLGVGICSFAIGASYSKHRNQVKGWTLAWDTMSYTDPNIMKEAYYRVSRKIVDGTIKQPPSVSRLQEEVRFEAIAMMEEG